MDLAVIEPGLDYVDPNRPAMSWVFFGNDGTAGSALTFGSFADSLEILKRLWARGIFHFYAWGPTGVGGNVAAWHANVWIPFRAWVAAQNAPSTWKRLAPRGYRGRPSRSTKTTRNTRFSS